MKRRTPDTALKTGAGAPGAPGGRARVLVVEADTLMRWSMMAYLERWFDVLLTDTVDAAHQLLDRDIVSALIVSDELPDDGARQLEVHARRANPAMRIVRTGTGVDELPPPPTAARATAHGRVAKPEAAAGPRVRRTGGTPPRPTNHIEKPFALAELAVLLGVPARELPPG
ncbi:MAG: hypothetical protein AB7Q17_07110 [Phycisphaerae bacterium]